MTIEDMAAQINPCDLSEIHREVAEVIGIDNLVRLSKWFGGTSMYISQVKEVNKKIRYKLILEEYDRNNIKKLAVKYDVSERTVYRIINNHIKEKAALKD